MELNEIKKDLYKSKEMAKFSHYNKGRLFYEVKFLGSTYLFPIDTVQESQMDIIYKVDDTEVKRFFFNVPKLSEDLGETSFANEIKGSELIRWIDKAIKNEEIKKVG